jgi:hypothetical protein
MTATTFNIVIPPCVNRAIRAPWLALRHRHAKRRHTGKATGNADGNVIYAGFMRLNVAVEAPRILAAVQSPLASHALKQKDRSLLPQTPVLRIEL